jgi:hypothetical protein
MRGTRTARTPGATSVAARAGGHAWRPRSAVPPLPVLADVIAAAPPVKLDGYYRAVSTVSFTLLGLWWVVAQSRYQRGGGAAHQRRHATGIALFFLLPGVMCLIASVDSELSALWRVAFGACAAIGLVEAGLYLATDGARTVSARALRLCGLGLYAVIAAVAIDPTLAVRSGVGLRGQEVASILMGLLLFVGANLVWLGLTEPAEAAGA